MQAWPEAGRGPPRPEAPSGGAGAGRGCRVSSSIAGINPASSTALYGPRPCERLKQPLGRVSDLIHGCLEGLCIRP